jgi:hypothetical protein
LEGDGKSCPIKNENGFIPGEAGVEDPGKELIKGSPYVINFQKPGGFSKPCRGFLSPEKILTDMGRLAIIT